MALESGGFYGSAVTKRRVADLVLVDSQHQAQLRIPRHSHERAYLSLIRAGSFTETFGRRTRVCAPGMLLINPPGEVHAEIMDQANVVSLNIELGPSWLTRLLELGTPADRPAVVSDEQITRAGLQLLREMYNADGDFGLAAESLTWEILHTSIARTPYGSDRAKPRWLRDVRDLIDGSLKESLTLRHIAEKAGVHPVHFAVVFRQFHGCSLGEYSRRRRLTAACARLADQQVSLSQVAYESGFADQSHFNRTLKRYTGMTPRQYRTFLAFKKH